MAKKLTLSVTGDAVDQIKKQSKFLGISYAAYINIVLKAYNVPNASNTNRLLQDLRNINQSQANHSNTQQIEASENNIASEQSKTQQNAVNQSKSFIPKFAPL